MVAFVNLRHPSEATRVIQLLDGIYFLGRPLRVRPRERRARWLGHRALGRGSPAELAEDRTAKRAVGVEPGRQRASR